MLLRPSTIRKYMYFTLKLSLIDLNLNFSAVCIHAVFINIYSIKVAKSIKIIIIIQSVTYRGRVLWNFVINKKTNSILPVHACSSIKSVFQVQETQGVQPNLLSNTVQVSDLVSCPPRSFNFSSLLTPYMHSTHWEHTVLKYRTGFLCTAQAKY